MTTELHSMLLAWLESGTEPQVAHATYRLSLPDAIGYVPEMGEVALQVEPPDPWDARIRACDDFNPGCCASPLPFCSRFVINPTRERCIECLSEGT